MKKFSYYLGAAASLALAVCMSMSLSSCTNEDNPSIDTTTPSGSGKLIIKEIAVGGGFKTIENKSYNWCKAMMLYNNSDQKVRAFNLAIGTVPPGNAHANNGNYNADGKLNYADSDSIPLIYGIWYKPTSLTVEPYSDVVIAINGAIDHTTIAPEAYDLSDPNYYAMYDPSTTYTNPNAYPTPARGIDKSHYFKANVFGLGNAWAISVMCPNLVLFQVPENVDIEAYCADPANVYYDGGKETAANYCVKIPKAWILDGVETYRIGYEADSKKRLTDDIDAGYALYNSNKKYSAYRNVDKDATEAIAENAGKLVYDYDQAVEGTSEPSGIDAAASIKNGAKIVYQDTNNSSADFHLRKTWSLK